MPADRSPRFDYEERVRLTRVAGTERDFDGNPFDARPLVGEELMVVGAHPNEAQDGWMIIVAKPVSHFDETMDVDEAVLESLEPGARPEWRDDVTLWLLTDARAAEVAEAAVGRLSALPQVEEVDCRVDGADMATVWVWSSGDALDLFHRIVGLSAHGWEEKDCVNWIASRWTRSDDEFLVPGIVEADVTYRRWTTPERRRRCNDRTPR